MRPEYRAVEVKMGNGTVYYNLEKKESLLWIPFWDTVKYRTGRAVMFESLKEVDRHIRACENDRLRTHVVSRTIIDIKGE